MEGKRPKLKKDWEGRYVRLLLGGITRAGIQFDAGEILKVKRNYNGLHLESVVRCPICSRGRRREILVAEYQVELLPLDFKPEPEPQYIAMTAARITMLEHISRDESLWKPIRVIADDMLKELKS